MTRSWYPMNYQIWMRLRLREVAAVAGSIQAEGPAPPRASGPHGPQSCGGSALTQSIVCVMACARAHTGSSEQIHCMHV